MLKLLSELRQAQEDCDIEKYDALKRRLLIRMTKIAAISIVAVVSVLLITIF